MNNKEVPKTRKYKRTSYGSTAYTFRLSGRTEDQYRKQLEQRISNIQENDNELSFSQALRELVKAFLDKAL